MPPWWKVNISNIERLRNDHFLNIFLDQHKKCPENGQFLDIFLMVTMNNVSKIPNTWPFLSLKNDLP